MTQRRKIQIKILDDRLNASPEWTLRRATPGSAGMDVMACVNEPTPLYPGECKLIPLGFALHIADPSLCALLLPRSGLGHKEGIVLGNLVGLIDSDFTQQAHASIWNRSESGIHPFWVSPGMRIAQLMFVPVVIPDLVIVDEVADTRRGGFGSTGA